MYDGEKHYKASAILIAQTSPGKFEVNQVEARRKQCKSYHEGQCPTLVLSLDLKIIAISIQRLREARIRRKPEVLRSPDIARRLFGAWGPSDIWDEAWNVYSLNQPGPKGLDGLGNRYRMGNVPKLSPNLGTNWGHGS